MTMAASEAGYMSAPDNAPKKIPNTLLRKGRLYMLRKSLEGFIS